MKTQIKKISAGSVSFIFLILTACTDHFEDLNTPHNLLLDDKVSVDMLFTGQLSGIMFGLPDGRRSSGNWCGMSVTGDDFPFAEGRGSWSGFYSTGRNLKDIIRLCKKRDEESGKNEHVNKMAIARILNAWNFARATDQFGPMPYFEACLPIEEAVFTPKYDTQKEIYADLLNELKEAATQLTSDQGSYGNADFVYRGDIVKWRKFANSIRLRLALRIRYADPAMAQANMADLTEANLIIDNNDNFFTNTNNTNTRFQSAMYADLINRKEIVVKPESAKTFLDILNNNDDPRTKVFNDTAKANLEQPQFAGHSFGYRGRPLLGSCPVNQKWPYSSETVSRWSYLMYVPIIAKTLYKASETYFSLAEAALFGIKGSAADAQGYYQKGLEIEMAYTKAFFDACEPQLQEVIKLHRPSWTQEQIDLEKDDKKITQAEIDDFLANAPVVTLTGSEEQMLEQIINQKLVAFFPNQDEGWAEFRRTGYPRILIGDDQDALRGQIPRRIPWPTNEELYNIDQYNIALDLIGGVGKDNRLTKIWWDANPDPIKPHPETVIWMDREDDWSWLETLK